MYLLDVRERAHVVDIDSQTDLEVKPLGHVRLIYNSAAFKSIANGRNVSQALVSRLSLVIRIEKLKAK